MYFDDDNLIVLTDSYKGTQYPQYPKDTTNICSYQESRGGLFEEITPFGLSAILKRYLTKPITRENILEALDFFLEHFGSDRIFNLKGWTHILSAHGGYLPLRIKAVPEGTTVPVKNVIMTVENTCPECYWVTNYMETLLSQTWYPTTVCTYSRECKKTILRYLTETGTPEEIEFKLVDFGVRGTSSMDSAMIGGCAHLVNFKSSDNMPSIMFARKYYGERMAAFGIPASEHSTITSWTQEGEVDAYSNMIDKFGDQPLYACVSDSYDIKRACSEYWGNELKEKVKNAKGTLLVRPDSGTPDVVDLDCMERLGAAFGVHVNSKGYKLLNKVKIIQGDGVDYFSIRKVLETLKSNGWSADNISFGMGGNLLQNMNRDTQSFAIKCSSAVVGGGQRDVYKSPADGSKTSKKGRLGLYPDAKKKFVTREEGRAGDVLEVVYENGELFHMPNLAEIRERAAV